MLRILKRHWWFTLVLLVACGGAGPSQVPDPEDAGAPMDSPSEPSEPEALPLRLVSLLPEDRELEVPVTSTVVAIFNGPLDRGSIGEDSLQVFRGGVRLAGRLEPGFDRMEFFPREILDYDSEFEIVVGSEIRSREGNPLGEAKRGSFRTKIFSTRLPIVWVDPMGGEIVDEPKIPARMRIREGDGSSFNFLADPPDDYDSWVGIEIRGSSSQELPKKQYAFETWEENFEEIESQILGMPEETDWILQGPYLDRSLIRNPLAYDLARVSGHYASHTRFAELFLADAGGEFHYWGVFLAMEKIKRDVNRVDIKKLKATDESEPKISGGYLLAIDRVHEGDRYFDTDRGTRLIYLDPKGDAITSAQEAWIQDYFDDFESALYGPDFRDTERGYRRFLDVDSMADFFLLNELAKNRDAFRFSTYMYKDRESKLKMGPVWDFDLAMNNDAFNLGTPAQGWMLCGSLWVDRLRDDPDFVSRLRERYEALREGPWSDASVLALIEDYQNALDGAAQRNFEKWPILGEPSNLFPLAPPGSYDAVLEGLKVWLFERLSWMDANLASICRR